MSDPRPNQHARSVVASWLDLDGGNSSDDEQPASNNNKRQGSDDDDDAMTDVPPHRASHADAAQLVADMMARPGRLGVGASVVEAAQAAAVQAKSLAESRLQQKIVGGAGGKRRRGDGEENEEEAAAREKARRLAQQAAEEAEQEDSRTLVLKGNQAKKNTSYSALVDAPAPQQEMIDKKKAKMQRDRKKKKLKKKLKLAQANGTAPPTTIDVSEEKNGNKSDDESSDDETAPTTVAAPTPAALWTIDVKGESKENGDEPDATNEEVKSAATTTTSEPKVDKPGTIDGVKVRPNGRVRTKKRSKQKNIKKDTRPDHLKPTTPTPASKPHIQFSGPRITSTSKHAAAPLRFNRFAPISAKTNNTTPGTSTSATTTSTKTPSMATETKSSEEPPTKKQKKN